VIFIKRSVSIDYSQLPSPHRFVWTLKTYVLLMNGWLSEVNGGEKAMDQSFHLIIHHVALELFAGLGRHSLIYSSSSNSPA
jgi:hypothetical protein